MIKKTLFAIMMAALMLLGVASASVGIVDDFNRADAPLNGQINNQGYTYNSGSNSDTLNNEGHISNGGVLNNINYSEGEIINWDMKGTTTYSQLGLLGDGDVLQIWLTDGANPNDVFVTVGAVDTVITTIDRNKWYHFSAMIENGRVYVWENDTLYVNLTTTKTYIDEYWMYHSAGGASMFIDNITITLQENLTPNITSYYPLTSPLNITYDGTQEFNITATDPEGDTLSYQWYIDGSDILFETANYYLLEASTETAGNYNITIIVTDGNTNASQEWNVTIQEEPAATGHITIYEGEDLDDIAIDGIARILLTLKDLAPLIALFIVTIGLFYQYFSTRRKTK